MAAPASLGRDAVEWQPVPRALAYAAAVMGSGGDDTIVMWSSSEVRSATSVPDYLAPAEVSRLLQQKALLGPATIECVVPAEVVKAVKGSMLQMAAYGPEANFAAPVTQTPRWAAKVRTKFTHTGMLGMDMAALMGARMRTSPAPTPRARRPSRRARSASSCEALADCSACGTESNPSPTA